MLLQSKMYRPIQLILQLYKTKNDDNFLIFDSGVGDLERVLLLRASDGAFSKSTQLKQNEVEKYFPLYLYSCQAEVKPQTQYFS